MSYPTHLPTVAGRVPDPYIGQRAALAALASAQQRFGAWVESQPPVPSVRPRMSERIMLSRLAYGLIGVVVAVEVLFLFV